MTCAILSSKFVMLLCPCNPGFMHSRLPHLPQACWAYYSSCWDVAGNMNVGYLWLYFYLILILAVFFVLYDLYFQLLRTIWWIAKIMLFLESNLANVKWLKVSHWFCIDHAVLPTLCCMIFSDYWMLTFLCKQLLANIILVEKMQKKRSYEDPCLKQWNSLTHTHWTHIHIEYKD